MGIVELLKEATIEFPRPINREDAEKLLRYIAKELPATISSKIGYFKNYYIGEKGEVIEDQGTLEVTAEIRDIRKDGGWDYFKSKENEGDTSCISAIAAQVVPGWEPSEYRPEARKLWKDVRQTADEYFREEGKED